MLDKKQIGAIFLFECKMDVNQMTVRNINNSFDPGTDDKHTVQWRLKFCKGNESLEDEESTSAIFCRENASTTSRRQKMLSKSSSNPEAWIFMLKE